MNNICDDKLVTLIGNELSRVGLFTSVSEIEKSAIQIYYKLLTVSINGTDKFILNSDIKDTTYYDFLTNAIIVDIISRTRLPNVQNSFEFNSVVCLLDGYLYKLCVATNNKNFKARDIFDSILIALPENITATMQKQPTNEIKSTPKLCTNALNCKSECEDCLESVTLSLSYQGLCWGFRIDPELLELNQPLQNLDSKVLKNFISKISKLLCSNAKPILDKLHSEYNYTKGDTL